MNVIEFAETPLGLVQVPDEVKVCARATPPAGAAATAVLTKAVVAICVVEAPAVAVGAAGVPVKVGEARFAFNAKALVTSVVEYVSDFE